MNAVSDRTRKVFEEDLIIADINAERVSTSVARSTAAAGETRCGERWYAR